MFGDILSKLDRWFGSSFVVASLLPVLLFGGANVLMLGFVFPVTLKAIVDYFSAWAFAPLTFSLAFLIACAIVAYATDPLARWTIKVLRGANWRKSLAALGVAEESATLRSLDKDVNDSADVLTRLSKDTCDTLLSGIIDASFEGLKIAAISKPALIQTAEAEFKPVEAAMSLGEMADLPVLKNSVDALVEALKANCADITKLNVVEQTDADLCKRLNVLRRDCEAAIAYARKRAQSQWTVAVNARNSRMPQTSIKPTPIGNSFAALDDYFDEIFSIDIDFFLPIIRMILSKDPDASAFLSRAQQRLDFAARAVVFTVVFTAVWLGALFAEPRSALAVLAVGTGGLVATLVTIAMADASVANYNESIRAICILKRFEVLTALHMKLPTDWDTEKALWTSVNRQLQWGSAEKYEIVYDHPINSAK